MHKAFYAVPDSICSEPNQAMVTSLRLRNMPASQLNMFQEKVLFSRFSMTPMLDTAGPSPESEMFSSKLQPESVVLLASRNAPPALAELLAKKVSMNFS